MYEEPGFSDAGLGEVVNKTHIDPLTVRGTIGSLVKKGLIEIDNREDEYGIDKNNPYMHIYYLRGVAEGLVPHWVDEYDFEPAIIEIK